MSKQPVSPKGNGSSKTAKKTAGKKTVNAKKATTANEAMMEAWKHTYKTRNKRLD